MWLYGAVQVNSDSGAFSNVIREYNVRQGQLRLGTTFSAAALQEASNAVGLNLADSILNSTLPGEVTPNLTQGKLPTVQEIGNDDLLGVRNVLYPGNETPGTELYLNQAWPGIVMLGALGGQYSDRLLRYDTNQPSVFDTLGDLKSLLFCWESFKTAFQATWSKVGSVTSMADLLIGLNLSPALITQALAALTAHGITSFAQVVFSALIQKQNPEAMQALNLIAKLDAGESLDMLRRSVSGNSVSKTVSSADFLANAAAFFSQMGDARQYGMQKIDAIGTLATQSKTDFTAMVALNAASLFRFTGTAAVERLQNSNYELY